LDTVVCLYGMWDFPLFEVLVNYRVKRNDTRLSVICFSGQCKDNLGLYGGLGIN